MDASGQRSFVEAVREWRAFATRPVSSADELSLNLQALYDAIYKAEFENLDPAEVKASAEELTTALFDLYLTLRDRLAEWKALGLLKSDTPRLVRNAMRVVRYTIDIVGEVGNGYPQLGDGEGPYNVFEGPQSWTLMHPGLALGTRVELRSGDVILMRGRLNNSAAIARIGDVDAQFSHAGIVYLDREGGRWFVEALIEDGSVWTPLETALSHGTGRAVLFRHRDGALAARAAEMAADLVRRGTSGLFSWIPYDFTMDPKGSESFFCSKLVRHAFELASEGRTVLPSFPTRLSMTNRDFFDRLGVTAVDTFAPADLEVEPVFDLVAEWRDFRVTPALRMQDLLMSKLFDWMDEYGYEFREGTGIAIMALLGRLTSIWPDAMKQALSTAFGLPRIPLNMNSRMITTIGMLHKTAEPILQRLLALEAQRIATTGRPLHPREVQGELERQRMHAGGRIGYLVAPD